MRDTRPRPGKSLLQAWIPTYLHQDVRNAAHEDDCSMAAIAREALQLWLARRRYQHDSHLLDDQVMPSRLDPPTTES